MRTRVTLFCVLFMSLACEPEESGDDLQSDRSLEDEWSELEQERAVRDPGFAFVDVDGDNKYDEDVDHEAVLDSNGELNTPYDLAIPHDKWNPTLWHDEHFQMGKNSNVNKSKAYLALDLQRERELDAKRAEESPQVTHFTTTAGEVTTKPCPREPAPPC